MKLLSKICIAIIIAIAISCTTDTINDVIAPVGGRTEFTLSLEGVRTHIGEKGDDGKSYPLFWSEGDQISVNGVASIPLSADEAGGANAKYTFDNKSLSAPYCVAYPAAAKGQVMFAKNQKYISNTTFDDGVSIMYGYSEKESGSIMMKHLTGVLKIGIVGSATIQAVKISTIDRAPIAGAFDIDFKTGVLTPSSEAESVIDYSFDGGVELNETTPTYVHVAVPEGVYEELYVTLFDTKGGMMCGTVKAGEERPLAAGKVREFWKDGAEQCLHYEANTDLFVIRDFHSLIEFKEQVNLGTLTKDAVLVDDVVIPTDEATLGSISGARYTGTLNGNGFAIKGLEHPLFHTMGGTIKGLHLEDVNIVDRNNFARTLGALVNTYSGTNISHCSVSGTISLSRNLSAANYLGGLIGQVVSEADCEISNCVSRCKMTFNLNDTSKRSTTIVGGVVANTGSTAAGVTITLKHNTNLSTIDVIGAIPKANLILGGVIGLIDLCPNMVVEGCANAGNIAADFAIAQGVCMGGVVGFYERTSSESGCSLSIAECNNTGKLYCAVTEENRIYNANTVYNIMVGGCFGRLDDGASGAMVVSNCDNSGLIDTNLSPTLGRVLSRVDVGGVVGYIRGQIAMSGCDNRADEIALVMNKPEGNTTVAGLVGRVVAYTDASKPVLLTDCANYAKVFSNVTENTTSESYIAGAVGQIYGYKDKIYTIKLDNVDNYGSVMSMSNGRLAGSTTSVTIMAGVVGAIGGGSSCVGANNKADYSKFTVVNCDNVGDRDCNSSVCATGKSYYCVYAAGMVGYTDAPFEMKSCSNSMPYLYDAEVSEKVCCYGGLISIMADFSAISATSITGSDNSGTISVKAQKRIKEVVVSGIIGCMDSDNAVTIAAKDITNSAKIDVGGLNAGFDSSIAYVAGIIGKMSSNTNNTYNFANVANMGEIEIVNMFVTTEEEVAMGDLVGGVTRGGVMLSSEGESYIGGVVGNLTKSLFGVKSFCKIKAYMFKNGNDTESEPYHNVGMFTGSERASNIRVINSQVGGSICTSAKRDAQNNVVESVVNLTIQNYFDYIYGKPITASTASGDSVAFVER